MTSHRFIRPFDFSQPGLRIDDKELIHQWQHVLRFIIGEKIILCDGKGQEAEVELIEQGKKESRVRILKVYPSRPESPREVTLYFSPLKRENTELILQKGVELGIHRFVPIRCRRTIKQQINQERLEKIILEATEQSGRGYLPVLEVLREADEVIPALSGGGQTFFFELDQPALSHQDLQAVTRLNLCVGPEGGWDPAELRMAQAAKLQIRGLGQTTLRAETAAIAASTLALLSV